MDKLRALQKRYGQTAAKPGLSTSHALLSTSSAADSTSSLASLTTTATATAKPASIQDLRARLSTVLRSGDASSSSSDLGCAAPVARGPSAASTTTTSSGATDAVQALKERLARIKHTAATSASS